MSDMAEATPAHARCGTLFAELLGGDSERRRRSEPWPPGRRGGGHPWSTASVQALGQPCRWKGSCMKCYECVRSGRDSEAVAVCRLCGAAVCTDHVRTEPVQLRGTAQPGKVIHDQPARQLTCVVCRAAEESP
ncbi:DUF2180 family protein [Streptomyces regalis]|uniref:DUF2180 family protein n=1 Tax=Streptomyces regalis TaxID=68262 RepID=UPI00099E1AFA